jgi:hypothetical protein
MTRLNSTPSSSHRCRRSQTFERTQRRLRTEIGGSTRGDRFHGSLHILPVFAGWLRGIDSGQKLLSQANPSRLVPSVGFSNILFGVGGDDEFSGHRRRELCVSPHPTKTRRRDFSRDSPACEPIPASATHAQEQLPASRRGRPRDPLQAGAFPRDLDQRLTARLSSSRLPY